MKYFSPLRHLPIILAFTIFLLPWIATMAGDAVGAFVPEDWMGANTPLYGVADNPDRPKFSLAGVWSGEFQRKTVQYFSRHVPYQATSVRWKNQIYYSLMRASPLPSLVIGKHRQLFERIYLEEYCTRSIDGFFPLADAWAAHIKRVQDFYEAHGKPFVYVITPSKAARYPEYIPSDFPCPDGEGDRLGLLPVYDEILGRNGIHYVDTATLVGEMKSQYSIDLFARGSTHWNALAASVAVQRLTDAVNRQSSSPKLQPFTFTFKTTNNPYGTDIDLAELLNMARRPIHYEAPEVTISPASAVQDCQPASIVEVGGSFMFELNEILMKTACRPKISYYYYYELNHYVYPGGTPVPMDENLRRRELLGDADVVIFEENEQQVARSVHGRLFFSVFDAALRTGER